jgi:hypothetical protein
MTISAGPTDCSSGLAKRVFDNMRYDNPWKASQSGYVVGVLGCPLTLNGYGYSVSAVTTGITGGIEPTWPLVIGNTVVDGGVTWTCDVACGPSGKGVNYQGVLAAADLNAFRVLAYDAARAVADSLTIDKVDLPTQTSSAIPSWTAVTFQNSWGNLGSGNATAAYFKDAIGIVHLKGIVTGGAAGTTMFALPAGYRPLESHQWAGGAYTTANVFAAMRLDANGNVYCYTPTGVANQIFIDFQFVGEQ